MVMVKRAGRTLKNIRDLLNHPLHKGRPVQTLVRWARQTASVLSSPVLQTTVPYVGGSVLHWPLEAGSVMICARFGLGEYADMAFCLHFLRPDDLFVDVGANAGVYTILAARAVGCHVVAAEPVPTTFDLLMQNVYANHVSDRVDARRIGIGRTREKLHFTSSLWSYNHVVEAGGENTVEVDVLPLDDVLSGRSPTMLKIDVEGFEAEVIGGATMALSDPSLKAVLIEMYEGHVAKYGGHIAEIETRLRSLGFNGPYWYDPAVRSLVAPGGQEATKYNQIFVRDMDDVKWRIERSKSYEVHGALV